jgi:hypothetical protein
MKRIFLRPYQSFLKKYVGPEKVGHNHVLIPDRTKTDDTSRKRKRGPQHCCVFCCKAVHKLGRDGIYKQCKERMPYRPWYFCSVCNVTLCREKKYKGATSRARTRDYLTEVFTLRQNTAVNRQSSVYY